TQGAGQGRRRVLHPGEDRLHGGGMIRPAAAMIVAGGLWVAGPATAAAWTADDLRDACSDGELYYISGACAGYLAGAMDADPGDACLPEAPPIFALEPAADAVGTLDAVAGETGPALAKRALAEAFPC